MMVVMRAMAMVVSMVVPMSMDTTMLVMRVRMVMGLIM